METPGDGQIRALYINESTRRASVIQQAMADLGNPDETGSDTGRPLRLIGRRHLRTNNSWMHNIPALSAKNPCTLQVNPEDAARLRLKDGQTAQITSNAGTVNALVEITDRVMEGVVSLPHGWGHDMEAMQMQVAAANPGVNTNRIVPGAVDPLSATAVLNAIAVTVS
ncbi:MAG: molybdopterin dinucleotide binding domain-containing protein [Desulfosalsimonas sp.]|uniref:molybdopterin dinucleotide binding domain-containing protein n=1 Tax=Desulfosalsimonas sp. TaxID=3073848 RepID=UPI003970C1A4